MNKLKFSEETILSVSKTTLANAHAHQAGLAEFGISQQLLDDFEANIQAAEALPNEVSSRIDLRDMTPRKGRSPGSLLPVGAHVPRSPATGLRQHLRPGKSFSR